jgi:hypothetical protein
MIGAMLAAQMCWAQLSGTYTIGNSDPDPDDYGSFTAAVNDLTTLGVDGAVTFDVEDLVYLESVAINQVTGASAENTITFRDAVPGGTRPKIKGGAGTTAPAAVVALLGADYVTFDGIDIQDTIAGVCTRIQDGAWNNTFKNLTITGLSVSNTSSAGCIYTGSATLNNGGNLFDNVTFNETYYSVSGTGNSTTRDQGLEVRNCKMNGGYRGVAISDLNNARIHHNDITVGWVGATVAVTGVYVAQLRAGDSCFVYANKIHGMQSTGSTAGILVASNNPVTSSVLIYNNMIYGFIMPSGSSTAYGIEVDAATTGLYDNSIFVDQVAASGNKCGIYMGGVAGWATVTMKNNIVVMGQTTATANYGIYRAYGTIVTSDYNCFYSSGGGTGYKMGYYVAARTTLADWQAYFQSLLPPSDFDLNSVAGNPGYISMTDPHNLHINAAVGLVHLRGILIPGITDDIDGDVRWSLPDIGADEYTYTAPTEDYWVRKLLGWSWLTTEQTALTTDAVVVNRGSANQTDVPVIFFYDGVPQDTVLVSLDAYTADTVTFNWTSPVAPDTIVLEAQSYLTGDAVLANDSALASVRIIKLPMAGTYTIGPTRSDYTTFTAAVADLSLRGVSDAVTFNVAEGTYSESVTIPAAMTPVQYTGIRGASATHTITFHPAPTNLDTPPAIVSNTSPALNLNGADYITFDGINISVTVGGKAVQITTGYAGFGGADYNAIKNCTLTGAAETVNTNYGVHITGGGNDYNVIDNVTVDHSAYNVVYLAGVSGASDVGTEVRNCTLVGGLNSVTLTYENGAVVRDCDIQPGYVAATLPTTGISCGTQTVGEVATAYRNKIHNFTGGSTATGIAAGPTGVNPTASFLAYNNFVYDFNVTGTGVVCGLRASAGTAEFYGNSVSIGDVGTTGAAYGFYMVQTTTTVVHLKNNVFRVDEPTTACWAIYKDSGTLYSDYNAVYSPGPGALYNVGYAASTSYPTIMQWQGAGFDAHSVEGNPGFVSATDLHIQPQYSLLDGAGVDTAGIATDIDGDGRGSPPDIGADEYAHTTMAHDYGVNKWVDWVYNYLAAVPVVIRAEVKNYGSSDETDVPVRLFYNGVQQDEVLLSLTSGQRDTVELDWTPPVPALNEEINPLVVKAFCPSDTFAPNDSIKVKVRVVDLPLSGVYDLGGGANHYATFSAAVTALTVRGISAEVTFDVYAGTYSENVTLGQIAGASSTSQIIFRKHLSDVVTLTSAVAAQALFITGADYVTFDGINMSGTVANNTVVLVGGDADYVTFKNLSITGRDSTTAVAVRALHLQKSGNDNFLADHVTVRGAMFGISTQGGGGFNNNVEIKNCDISGASYPVYLDSCDNALVHNNDLQPMGYGASGVAYGVYLGMTAPGGTVRVYNNRIHNLRHNGSGTNAIICGVYAAMGSGRYAYIYNNFFWGWQNTGAHMAAFTPGSGQTYWYYNTVYMEDQPSGSDARRKAFYYRSAGATTPDVKNNIFISAEDADTVDAFLYSTGAVSSNFNCFYDATGANPKFWLAPGYITLAAWQATGNDSNSIVGNPGLVSTTDLHIDSLATLVDSAGTPIVGITDDIDGDLRDAAFPDIGADEYDALCMPDVVDSLTIFPDADAGDVLLQWAAAPGAYSYKIYRGATYDFLIDGTTYIGQTTGTSYTDVGVLATTGPKFYVVLASTDHIARGR